ncbi:Pyruvate dehydrogenase E1 component [Nymphon striatum]|nr:Pyruvate dehydrogenase E1 component [Nymphon striatum]
MTDHYTRALPDVDPAETKEWLDSLDALAAVQGNARARYVIARLIEHADELSLGLPPLTKTPHINTIPPDAQPFFPGDEHIERRIRAFIRWNAAAMVVRANKDTGVGGHLSTYASSSSLYEVGFNHFFKGKGDGQPGDHVYFQGHAAPGVYSRAYIEGRLTEEQLDNFRQEVGGNGLSSYPHPRLMPDFWEYPTVSMGLGPINSIYHARFNRYLHDRRIDDTSNSRIWAFVGDGESDEPETLGAISLAGRAGLDNLTWVLNCNLQRLDGPVLVGLQVGLNLLACRRRQRARRQVQQAPSTASTSGLVHREPVPTSVNTSSARIPRPRKLVEAPERRRIFARCLVAGHDYQRCYAAYKAASGAPWPADVILAQTVKGWTLGEGFEGPQRHPPDQEDERRQMQDLRERLDLVDEIPLDELGRWLPPYFRPDPDQRRSPLYGRTHSGHGLARWPRVRLLCVTAAR